MGSGWLLDYGLVDEVSAADFIWPPQIIDDHHPLPLGCEMLGFDVPCKEDCGLDIACSRKRNRLESCAAPRTKACREKLRRNKLNDRFSELCSVLEPGRAPKEDKIVILNEATRRLSQLRLEARKLKESNDTLQDSIRSLKAEKLELRDEKLRLKAEKERMEQTLKCSGPSPPFIMPCPAAPIATFCSPYKPVPYPTYLPVGMWQWIAPATLDTSLDHVLRPPVA